MLVSPDADANAGIQRTSASQIEEVVKTDRIALGLTLEISGATRVAGLRPLD